VLFIEVAEQLGAAAARIMGIADHAAYLALFVTFADSAAPLTVCLTRVQNREAGLPISASSASLLQVCASGFAWIVVLLKPCHLEGGLVVGSILMDTTRSELWAEGARPRSAQWAISTHAGCCPPWIRVHGNGHHKLYQIPSAGRTKLHEYDF
jgi:hypothetical protein